MTERKWMTLSEAVDELMEQVLREHQERLAREQALVRLATELAADDGDRHQQHVSLDLMSVFDARNAQRQPHVAVVRSPPKPPPANI